MAIEKAKIYGCARALPHRVLYCVYTRVRTHICMYGYVNVYIALYYNMAYDRGAVGLI